MSDLESSPANQDVLINAVTDNLWNNTADSSAFNVSIDFDNSVGTDEGRRQKRRLASKVSLAFVVEVSMNALGVTNATSTFVSIISTFQSHAASGAISQSIASYASSSGNQVMSSVTGDASASFSAATTVIAPYPTVVPSVAPVVSLSPVKTSSPTARPIASPTVAPSVRTRKPSLTPTVAPTSVTSDTYVTFTLSCVSLSQFCIESSFLMLCSVVFRCHCQSGLQQQQRS